MIQHLVIARKSRIFYMQILSIQVTDLQLTGYFQLCYILSIDHLSNL